MSDAAISPGVAVSDSVSEEVQAVIDATARRFEAALAGYIGDPVTPETVESMAADLRQRFQDFGGSCDVKTFDGDRLIATVTFPSVYFDLNLDVPPDQSPLPDPSLLDPPATAD